MVTKATVIATSRDRVEAARMRVETLRSLVRHEMLPMNGTMHPEEVLPEYESAMRALALVEAEG